MSSTIQLMGIVNLTPDSFSDGGHYNSKDQALRHIEQLIQDGADIIDIGAESTRPGANPISTEEEVERLMPLLESYKRHFDTPLSLDTTKSEVADIGLEYGCDYINDVSGLTKDEKIASVVAKYQATLIIMHAQGSPETMQDNPQYTSIIQDTKATLEKAIDYAQNQGVKDIIIDPGIGFGKTVDHNLEIIANLKAYNDLNCPLLIGTSRKSFIGAITGASVEDRLAGTIASNIVAIQNGASILRVHDVKAHKQAIMVMDALSMKEGNKL